MYNAAPARLRACVELAFFSASLFLFNRFAACAGLRNSVRIR